MDKGTDRIRLQQWINIMQEYNASGMTKTAWCKANGIKLRRFFYWQRKLRKLAIESSDVLSPSLSLPERSGFYEITSSVESSPSRPSASCDSQPHSLCPTSDSSGIVLEYGSYKVTLENHFSEETLALLLGVLRRV